MEADNGVPPSQTTPAIPAAVMPSNPPSLIEPAPAATGGADSPAEKVKVPRWVPSDEARQRMEGVFQQHKFPTLAMREQLAMELGATLRQVRGRTRRCARAGQENLCCAALADFRAPSISRGADPSVVPEPTAA